MLVAFFDESGHSSGTLIFALAAFVAEEADWKVFDERWRHALRTHEAPYLHMREFAHRRGAFRGWSEERRRGLLSACVAAINSIPARTVGAAMSVAAFTRLDADGQSRLQDPFYCCFQQVVRGAAIDGMFEGEGQQVRMVFSQQDEFAPKARLLYATMARHIDVKRHLGALDFGNMRAVPALQAADLLVYELRHYYTRPNTRTRWALRAIVEHQLRTVGGHMLMWLPDWLIEAHATGNANRIMERIWSDPATALGFLSQTMFRLKD